MKKLKFIGLIAAIAAAFGLASCNNGEEPPVVEPEAVQYTISFRYEDGTLFNSLKFDENTIPTLPQAPEKEGYVFDAWYTDSALTTKYEAKAITSDITLYTKYYIQYSVKLVLDKDNIDSDEYDVIYTDASGKLTKPADPVRVGYTFIEWYSDPYYRGVVNFDAQVTKNTNYFAKWELNTYNITFDSDGGSNINPIQYTVEDLDVSLPIPNKTGYIFSHWEDSEGNQYNVIDTLTAKDYSLKAVYRAATNIDIICETLAQNHEISSYAALKDNIFTLNVEIRSRIATWTNHTNSNEKITFNQSYKMANDSRNIQFTAPADGILYVYVQNSSSGAATNSISVSENGTVTKYQFSGINAYGDYPAGSPICRIQIEVSEGKNYEIKRAGGSTIDIFEVSYLANIAEQEVTGLSLSNPGTDCYLEGSSLDFSNVKLQTIHNLYYQDLDATKCVFDTSLVDVTKPGSYNVTVKYGQYSLTYPVYIYNVTKTELGFNKTYESRNSYNGIYVNGKTQVIYELNEEFNSDYLSVLAYGKYTTDEIRFRIIDGITYEGFDSTTTGKKTITVKFTINSEVYELTYDVYVIDTTPYKDTNNNYVVSVDPTYEGVIGAQNNDKGNMFTTITQALQYLEQCTLEASSSKIMYVAKGYYNEKLEINIPNLTIIGEGISKATSSIDPLYVKSQFDNATIIEWDSLYSIEDEGGYYQITDSTATVAVREAAVNVTIKNLTISNYWNCEEVFQKEIDYLTKHGIASNGTINDHRALALIVQADKFTLDGCALLGYQDTVEFMTGRQFVYNTFIEGNTDFIFGTNATTYFYKSEIYVNNKNGSGYITAFKGANKGAEDYVDYGLIFDECKFTADSRNAKGAFALGRPWGSYSQVMIMNSEIGAHVGKTKDSRYVSMSGVNPTDPTVHYREYNNTGDAALTEAIEGMELSSASLAANYNNISVIFGTVNGALTYQDSWVPALYTELNK